MAIRSLSTASISTGSKRSKFWDQSTVIASGSYEWIASAYGTGSNTVLSLSSIPSTYKHLQIRANLTTNGLGGTNAFGGWFTFNNNTSGYSDHSMYGQGSNPPQSYNVTSRANMGLVTYSTNTSYTATNIVDILDYANTSKVKMAKALQGIDNNSNGICNYGTGLWDNTSAITSIQVYLNSGFGTHYFTTNASVHLYGIKG
jgi:hypothetical protein